MVLAYERGDLMNQQFPSIYLSPSTQEKNIGALEYGTEENRMNQFCDIIQPWLKLIGYQIYRNSPIMTLEQVVKHSNSKKPDIHVAFHSNASSGEARGSLVLCHRFGGEGERLARAISKELEAITPTKDFGVKEGCNWLKGGKPLYETAHTNAPAVIIEMDFHDNPEGAKWIMANMDRIAEAIVNGINNFFGINSSVCFRKIIENQQKTIGQYESLFKEFKQLADKTPG